MPGDIDVRSAVLPGKKTHLLLYAALSILGMGLVSSAWAGGYDDEAPASTGPSDQSDEDSSDHADEGSEWGESVSDPFADLVVEAPTTSDFSDRSVSAGGFVRSRMGLWVERLGDNPFASAQQNLDVWFRYRRGPWSVLFEGHAEYDPVYLYERDTYDEPTLDAHELYFDTREAKLELSLSSTLISIGRQIIPIGESNLITPIDVSNPYDLREIGLADVADLRIPLLATRVSHVIGTSQIEFLAFHESRFDFRSPPYGPFSQLPELLGPPGPQTYEYHHRQDRFDIHGQEALLRVRSMLKGFELSVAAGSVLDNRGVFVLPASPPAPGQDVVNIELDHRRHGFLSYSMNRPYDAWVFKLDLGVIPDLPLNVWDGENVSSIDVDERLVTQLVVGADYSGLKDTIVSVELGKNFHLDRRPDTLGDYAIVALAIRASRTFLRGDMALTSTSLLQGKRLQYGWLSRLDMEYRLREGIKLSLGYATYHPGDELSFLSGLGTHDRVFCQLRWDFFIL